MWEGRAGAAGAVISAFPQPSCDGSPAWPESASPRWRRLAPALVSLYKSAGVSLTKHGLSGQRAAVYLVVDYSGSMKP